MEIQTWTYLLGLSIGGFCGFNFGRQHGYKKGMAKGKEIWK